MTIIRDPMAEVPENKRGRKFTVLWKVNNKAYPLLKLYVLINRHIKFNIKEKQLRNEYIIKKCRLLFAS